MEWGVVTLTPALPSLRYGILNEYDMLRDRRYSRYLKNKSGYLYPKNMSGTSWRLAPRGCCAKAACAQGCCGRLGLA